MNDFKIFLDGIELLKASLGPKNLIQFLKILLYLMFLIFLASICYKALYCVQKIHDFDDYRFKVGKF